MKLSNRAEEILENLWEHANRDRDDSMEAGIIRNVPELDELSHLGFVETVNGSIALTAKGKLEGEKIVRRHRLAERLFTDVLDIKKKFIHSLSCQFEHLLHDGIEDSICVLLGHPKTCPHGQPIPPGDCCRKLRANVGKVISSLVDLKVHQKGRIAYLHTHAQDKLQKLMAIGVLPGMAVTLLQTFPSYVLQIGQSQFAIDKELAETIFVRTPG